MTLFQKLLEATYAGEEDYEFDEDLINLVTAEQNTLPPEESNTTVFISSFIKAHLSCMMLGRRLDDREHEILQMFTEQMDEIIFGAYECYSLDRNEDELIETLIRLVKIEVEEQELECASPGNESSCKIESKKSDDYQRDSWPMGFEKMVDRTKASMMMENFKGMMSALKYSILQGVISCFT